MRLNADMPAVLVDGRLPAALEEHLRRFAAAVCRTVRHPALCEPEAFHPDMQLFSAGRGRFVCCPELYEYYRSALPAVTLFRGETRLGENYPDNIAYNACLVGHRLFCLRAHTDPVILRMAGEEGWEVVDVRQGYANCSVAAFGENEIVTADPSIASAAQKLGMQTLRITPGHIRLSGYPYGFIGGCFGRISPACGYFFGDIRQHPDAAAIAAFAERARLSLVCASDLPLSDYGSILRLA